jgi:hypothetical protein
VPSGPRMTKRHVPPRRTSMARVVVVKPFGPHQLGGVGDSGSALPGRGFFFNGMHGAGVTRLDRALLDEP